MAVVLILVGGLAIAGERSLQASRETSAANSVSSFQSYETTYQRSWGGFSTTAAALGNVTLGAVATCGGDNEINQLTTALTPYDTGAEVLSGYTFTYKAATGFTGQGGCAVDTTYSIIANSVDGKTKNWCADSSGIFYTPATTLMNTTGAGCLVDNTTALPIGQ